MNLEDKIDALKMDIALICFNARYPGQYVQPPLFLDFDHEVGKFKLLDAATKKGAFEFKKKMALLVNLEALETNNHNFG